MFRRGQTQQCVVACTQPEQIPGPQGSTGPIGAQGVRGVIGNQGAQGSIGVQGQIGATGVTGSTGFTGAQGSTGSTGAQGPGMSQSLSVTTITSTFLVLASYPFGTYFNITNSGLNAISLPATVPSTVGGFWVLRNNTNTYLSIALSGGLGGLTTPLAIAPSTSVTIAVLVASSSYVLF
jgi:hypothetical protein